MQQHPFFKLIALVMVALFAMSANAADKSAGAEDAAGKLSSLLRSYESYQADFIQIVVNENGSRVQETRGALKAKRPGLFYWETSACLFARACADPISKDSGWCSLFRPQQTCAGCVRMRSH